MVLQCIVPLLFLCSNKFLWPHAPQYHARTSRLLLTETSIRGVVPSTFVQEDKTGKLFFPETLVKSLDLLPLMQKIATHAATRRGKDALLALATCGEQARDIRWSSRGRKNGFASYTSSGRPSPFRQHNIMYPYQATVAESMEQAHDEYERVKQATLALQGFFDDLSYPPLYGTDSTINPWSIDFVVESDDDHWLHYSSSSSSNNYYYDNVEDIMSLEDVLQAEQVIRMLLNVFEWASQAQVAQRTPLLADIGKRISNETLWTTFKSIQSAVEIVRVRTVSDPNARSTFHFQLNGTTFRVLGEWRERAGELTEVRPKSTAFKVDRRLSDIQEEIRLKEREIQQALVLAILQCRQEIIQGLNAVAELDVIFSKAAFGLAMDGQFPSVMREGRIHADQFVHPLLGTGNALGQDSSGRVVPIDLRISSEKRALIISGMNGGGKSVALKSFGIAACLVQLGIPIPSTKVGSVPRVDFFDEILTSVGDGQDVARGESTFTAHLNTYSTIIDTVSRKPDRTSLILLDELGSGTEASSGGAIGQAILERLLQSGKCRIVATTHSPRLKVLSFESGVLDCATVLLSHQQGQGHGINACQPTFQLQYGLIGESHAIEAASRCSPALPSDVLERATALVLESTGSKVADEDKQVSIDYIRALSRSLEKQLQLAEQLSRDAEAAARSAAQCRQAMVSLAGAYERHLSYLQNRAEKCYQSLQGSSDDSFKIVGVTLSELRVVRQQVKNQAQQLRDQGLRIVPDSYVLREGESVVVVSADSMWNGLTGRVTLATTTDDQSFCLAKDEVLVALSLNPMDDDWMPGAAATSGPQNTKKNDQPVRFKRYQLAIWDYDSVWEEDRDDPSLRMTSIQESKRRLAEVLASVKSTSPPVTSNTGTGNSFPLGKVTDRGTFKSSRERKASRPKNAKRTRRK